jgi:hypothetical protein
LIEAAKKLRELVANMETLDEIKGFIIYKPEAIKSDLPDADKQLANPFEFEILKKFEGKVVQDFVPAFLLKQHESENNLEYTSFDQCVDEYFSQAEKHREKVKLESQETAIFNKMHRI